jgi:hypothetical protein
MSIPLESVTAIVYLSEGVSNLFKMTIYLDSSMLSPTEAAIQMSKLTDYRNHKSR